MYLSRGCIARINKIRFSEVKKFSFLEVKKKTGATFKVYKLGPSTAIEYIIQSSTEVLLFGQAGQLKLLSRDTAFSRLCPVHDLGVSFNNTPTKVAT